MTQKYYAIVTNLGAAKIANAAALGTKLNITQMAVGDGNGLLPTPTATQTALVHENRRAAINTLSVDPANASQIVAEQIIPETDGGFWIREMGLFSEDGTLIAVCNTPETYKPALQEGSGRTQTVRMILIVNSTDAITLKIDPSVVLATRKYVDTAIIEVEAYADNLMKDHVAAVNPHKQYLQGQNALSEFKEDDLLAKVFLNLGLGNAAKLNVGAAADMTGNSDKLLPTIAAVMGLFGKRTFAGSDYIRIPDVPGGLIIQWGYLNLSAGAGQATFPVAFPKAVIRCFCGDISSSSWSSSNFTVFGPAATSLTTLNIRAVTLNGTSFTMGVTGSQWIAIGY
jgi:hypothetical protein